jgi:hypothetical protein
VDWKVASCTVDRGSKPITYAAISTPDSGKCGAAPSNLPKESRAERVGRVSQPISLNHTTPPPSHDSHTNTTQSHKYNQHGRASHHTRCYQVRPSLLLVRKQILILGRSIFEPSGCFVEQPVLQCVQIKTMEPKAGDANPVQRFRVVLSDIRNFIQTMIATSMSGKDI